MAAEKNYVTRAGLKRLENEYHGVDDEIRNTHSEMGESCKRDSDLRENPEYMELRVKAMYALPEKKKKLFQKLREVVIIEDMPEYINFDGTTVIIGCKVSVIIDGEEETFTIAGADDGNLKENILSANAPLAQEMVGHKVGEKFKFKDINLQVLSVEKCNF